MGLMKKIRKIIKELIMINENRETKKKVVGKSKIERKEEIRKN